MLRVGVQAQARARPHLNQLREPVAFGLAVIREPQVRASESHERELTATQSFSTAKNSGQFTSQLIQSSDVFVDFRQVVALLDEGRQAFDFFQQFDLFVRRFHLGAPFHPRQQRL